MQKKRKIQNKNLINCDETGTKKVVDKIADTFKDTVKPIQIHTNTVKNIRYIFLQIQV